MFVAPAYIVELTLRNGSVNNANVLADALQKYILPPAYKSHLPASVDFYAQLLEHDIVYLDMEDAIIEDILLGIPPSICTKFQITYIDGIAPVWYAVILQKKFYANVCAKISSVFSDLRF
jgi:hypothetical protein